MAVHFAASSSDRLLKSTAVDANCECQDRQQEYNRRGPDTARGNDIGPHSAHLLRLTARTRLDDAVLGGLIPSRVWLTTSCAHEFTSDVARSFPIGVLIEHRRDGVRSALRSIEVLPDLQLTQKSDRHELEPYQYQDGGKHQQWSVLL